MAKILYNTEKLRWNNQGVEPTSIEKDIGHLPEGKYPAETANFRFNELDTVVNEVKEIVNVNDDRIINSFNMDIQTYYGNTKLISDFQDINSWYKTSDGLGGLRTLDKVKTNLGEHSIRLEENINMLSRWLTFAKDVDLNLEKLNNSEVSVIDDYLIINLFVKNVTKIISFSITFYPITGATGSNYISFTESTVGVNLVTGWNFIKVRKADCNIVGTATFDSIKSIGVAFKFVNNSASEYVSFQSIQLVKKDLLLALPNPFQKFGERELEIVDGEWFVGKENGEIVVKELSLTANNSQALRTTKKYGDFTVVLAGSTGGVWRNGISVLATPSFTLTVAENNLRLVLDEQLYNGSSRPDMRNRETVWKIQRIGKKVRVEMYLVNEPNVIYYVEGSHVNLPNKEAISISAITNKSLQPSQFIITEIPHAHTADIAHVANSISSKGLPVQRCTLWVNPGTFDFSAKNLINRKWIFPDGSISYEERPTRVLTKKSRVILEGSFNDSTLCEVDDNNTNSIYVGSLADLPNLSHTLNLRSCSQITGSLADLPNLSHTLNLRGCSQITGSLADLPNLRHTLNLHSCSQITGSLADLPNLSHYLGLFNCSQITGSLADLPNLRYFLSLHSCNLITGALNPHATLRLIFLQGTGMSPNDTDQTLINLMNNTAVTGGGMLQIKANRTSVSDTAFEFLTFRFIITEVI